MKFWKTIKNSQGDRTCCKKTLILFEYYHNSQIQMTHIPNEIITAAKSLWRATLPVGPNCFLCSRTLPPATRHPPPSFTGTHGLSPASARLPRPPALPYPMPLLPVSLTRPFCCSRTSLNPHPSPNLPGYIFSEPLNIYYPFASGS